ASYLRCFTGAVCGLCLACTAVSTTWPSKRRHVRAVVASATGLAASSPAHCASHQPAPDPGPWTGGRCRAASALAGAEAGRRQTAVSALPPQLPASARGDCARGSDAVLVCRRPSRGPRLAALAGARLYGGGVAGASAPASEPRSSLGAAAADEEPDQELVLADTRVLLVCGALACFVGSVTAVYVALTHDPNRKEDRPLWRRGEYLAGASVVGALAMAVIAQRGGPK
ncbi:unnamed protein product, partial [Prorocentrum cordatum]